MKSLSGKHLCRIPEKKGWQLKNIHGRHHVYETSAKVTATQCVILSEAKNLVVQEILRSLRSLRMTSEWTFAEVS